MRKILVRVIHSESIGRELARWAVKKVYEQDGRALYGRDRGDHCGRDNGTQYDARPEN